MEGCDSWKRRNKKSIFCPSLIIRIERILESKYGIEIILEEIKIIFYPFLIIRKGRILESKYRVEII